MTGQKIKTIVLLHIVLVLYSMCDVCSKLAAEAPVLSIRFCLCYGGMIALLGVYAIGWQQVIKRLPLTTAFANKAITIVWGLVWGVLIFNETITPGKIIGTLLVIAGVILYAYVDNDQGELASREEAGE